MDNVKIFASYIDENAKEQIRNLARVPAFQGSKIRIMPDCHTGKGCVIGFTADLGDKVIPDVVGVDIGCGMLLTKINDSILDLKKLDETIRACVPSGRRVRQKAIESFDLSVLKHSFRDKDIDHFERSIGTLGGGNHFIEVDYGKDGSYYLLIHTGSRNLGTQIADFYQKEAIAMQSLNGTATVPESLCYLEGKARENYLNDMRIAQEFAKENRRRIRDIIFSHMDWKEGESVECVHNYIGDDNIIRKGAISARQGEKLIIPLNMRDGVILGRGKGNEEWNYSAPHGAGRALSRMEARGHLSLDEFSQEMQGIYTTCINVGTLDEAPMAYKNPKDILTYLPQTATIEDILKPIYNFKAAEF